MVRHVLVPIDGSEQAWDALDHARAEYPNADVTLLYVINPVGAGSGAQVGDVSYGEEWYEASKARAEGLFEGAHDRFPDEAFTTETTVDRPARGIVTFADEHDADAIVMGSHGRDGVSRILLGSVAETVVRRSPVPVTVVR